jgi:TfoX/Sxy family transcriptional regulator of competence genes
MAYDQYLADRMRQILRDRKIRFEEKQMMGGLTFMVNGKMCVGIVKNNLMARIAPEAYEEALKKQGCQPMDFTGRPMKGFVFVTPEGTDDDMALTTWIDLALEFNPRARSSRK